jgi:hypothetical protein
MPYLNLDDNFADHPKVDALSDGAFRLHVAGMLYASKHLTDGFIPANRVPRLTRTYKARHLAELMEARMWLPADRGYTLHDYLDWNRSREQIEADRERIRKVRSEAGKKGAKARWHSA